MIINTLRAFYWLDEGLQNFLLVEIFDNIYGITTSNTDFDYSLTMYSIRHMGGLFAVFMSVINPVIGLSALLLVFLYPLYLLSLIKDHQKPSLPRPYRSSLQTKRRIRK